MERFNNVSAREKAKVWGKGEEERRRGGGGGEEINRIKLKASKAVFQMLKTGEDEKKGWIGMQTSVTRAAEGSPTGPCTCWAGLTGV